MGTSVFFLLLAKGVSTTFGGGRLLVVTTAGGGSCWAVPYSNDCSCPANASAAFAEGAAGGPGEMPWVPPSTNSWRPLPSSTALCRVTGGDDESGQVTGRPRPARVPAGSGLPLPPAEPFPFVGWVFVPLPLPGFPLVGMLGLDKEKRKKGEKRHQICKHI